MKTTGVVLAFLFVAAMTARTLIRQSAGPLAEDVLGARRTAAYAGTSLPTDASTISANGVVEPKFPELRLATDTLGRIAAIYVNEGALVEKGTVLAELENTVQRAQIMRAEAEIAAAQAELQRVMHGMRAQDINAISSEAVAAKARAALADSDLSRTQELVGKGSLAAAEFDQAKRHAEAENAAASAADSRVRGAVAGARQEDIWVAQAKLKAATAGLEEARGSLARTQIIAPLAGEVLRIKLHAGEFHNPMAGEPMIILGDTSSLRVRMDVDERDVVRVKLNARAYVTALAFGTRQFPGKVIEVGRRMGRRTVRVDEPTDRMDVKILEVEIELDGAPPPPLVAGMRVSAYITAAKQPP